ncbi:hypothetical protein ACJJTC_007834 [Scirpophaga incertulas]
MYKNKKDIDKHVEKLTNKLSHKEFNTRAYSIARLYYEVGDYLSCQKYVEQYLTQKDNNAAAYKLLGQALQKLGQNEKALEQFKTSLDIDPTHSSTILDICELLVQDDLKVDPGRARFWSEKAEAIFPRHPITFKLKEKLMMLSNRNPEALVNLILSELKIRPKDILLNVRLIKHYLHSNQIKDAINHSCNIEFRQNLFRNSIEWYETLIELLKHNSNKINDWLLQLLLLTVRERMCVLSLTEISSSSKTLTEANEQLFLYDQDLENVAKAGPAGNVAPGYGEFYATMLQHHRGQLALHAATFLLKKAKKDVMSWREAALYAAPLMLLAWHTPPIDVKLISFFNAVELHELAARRWYSEGSYRCSQSGHYLISSSETMGQTFIERISQCCSGTHWRDKIYEKIFSSRNYLTKIKSSHFATSSAMSALILQLPRKTEVEIFDVNAQLEYSNSLHHFVWLLMNYKNIAEFKCCLFDTLLHNASNIGPESLNKMDILAFLYCAALSSKQQKLKEVCHLSVDKPAILPANITNLLCSLFQMKWWDCACKFVQKELGSELTDIRSTLSRGIEVVRCIDYHGLDPELLCHLGRIFTEKAKLVTAEEEKSNIQQRAYLYYSSAIPLLEKLKSNELIKISDKRIFDYTHKELGTKELNTLLEESRLFIALNFIKHCEYDKAIELLVDLKSPEAVYYLAEAYKNIAMNDISRKDKHVAFLLKARSHAYKSIDLIKNDQIKNNNSLYLNIQNLIEELNLMIHKIDPDLSELVSNEVDVKYLSDENISTADSEFISIRNNHNIRNVSSTPKASGNITKYRTAIDSQFLDKSQPDHYFLERIEAEIKSLQKRDTTMNDFMEQTKIWFDEHRKLGNDIISTIHSNIQNTTDQFKLLKISVDNVKNIIDECKIECKDVGELKKQIAEMQKEINKLKKSAPEQPADVNDLYHLEEELRSNNATSTFTAQLPFTPPVMPQFNPRLVPPFPVPPNPYQFYGQNLYNLYNQYSQIGQTPQASGATSIFDPTRGQMNCPGFYPTPEAMFLEVAQLVNPSLSIPSTASAVTTTALPLPKSTISTLSTASITVPTTSSVNITKPVLKVDSKDTTRSLPVNVVITSSDPLPTCTTTPAPMLSVTIPSKHIKGSPHNYQISLPSTNASKMTAPPIFSFPSSDSKVVSNSSSISNWNQSSVFKATPSSVTTDTSLTNKSNDISDKSVVDGMSTTISPNTSHNKSRTLSEKSNTSIEYDPCPDFKPIIPLPAEVKVTTGEEDETAIFTSRAKLYRFVEKQWKERGLGEIKLLKHKDTGKVRVLMRREQIHKICANHIITSEMEIQPMKNETKAYFWVANDFADERVVLEKFCVRFKSPDIALEFYNKFEAARNNCSSDSRLKTAESSNQVELTANSAANNTSQDRKSVYAVGGFTFNSIPTFKTETQELKTDVKLEQTSTPKINIFNSFNFKANSSSPFSNIFNTSNSGCDNINGNSATVKESKLNSSDVVEEFEPNIEFKPVVPLPALVDQKTGEEDETVLFEHRAKLLRFDVTVKEWKERGLGNIKLLVHKENSQQVRLLMRREQIMKVCCNHTVTKDMSFQKMPNVEKAVTWCAKDFSDGELVSETFCLRFKTVETCDNFLKAIKLAQEKIKDDIKLVKEEQNAAKQVTCGFGDQFKPKPGSWNCSTCYTNNLENFNKCACCELPKPMHIVAVKNTNKIDILPVSTAETVPSGWGEAFKPKPGSWECKECLIRNEADIDICSACNSPQNPNNKSIVKNAPEDIIKFKFGIAESQTTFGNSEKKESTISTQPTGGLGWGDKFKPKQGSWECKQCFIRNNADINNCCACKNPRDANVALKDTTSTTKFSFGITTTVSENQAKSIFDGTGAHSFKFGIPSANQNQTTTVVTFGDQKTSNNMISTPKALDNQVAINFSLKKTDEGILNVTSKTLQNDSHSSNVTDSSIFNFVLNPKINIKTKSPVKSPKAETGEESGDDNEYVSEDEASHIHFSPVIPLPDKVEVVTGEENETELYGHRAKLFRFVSGEWKERGIGIVKILKNQQTGKLRVVMRREQILKICLNHILSPEIIYTPKDDKTWLFAANDYSEGELTMQQFCLRFKNKEIATQFKESIEKAIENKTTILSANETDDNEVVFIGEVVATPEERQKAKELMLPENFFTYKAKQPCPGCRGCDLQEKQQLTATLSTPVKISTASISSPVNSIYGTPVNFDKTADVTMFRTPLGSLGSNTKSISPMFLNSVSTNSSDSKNKENTFNQKPIIFGQVTEQNSLFGIPQSKPAIASDVSELQSTTKISGLLAAPKLNTIGNADKIKSAIDPKSIFESAVSNTVLTQSKPLFGNFLPGTSSSKSIFGFSTENKSENTEETGVKSVCGSDNGKQVNPFNNNNQGSIIRPGALLNNQEKSATTIFGARIGVNANQFQSFGSENEIFGNNLTWPKNASSDLNKPDVILQGQDTVKAENKTQSEDTPFKVDGNLTFAALSSSGPGFTVQKKEDFQWEGAGQQLFTTSQKSPNKEGNNESITDTTTGEDSTAGADEEYDPHYEPIVPLPDKITVTTGEEDEEKIFGERCKLYRYDEKGREWKERGVGELKILYHQERKTYRLLLRREQVHKAVLNMLLFMDLELLPLKNSDRAWTWAGRNYAETPSGQQEMLAVRFKNLQIATEFHDKVVECVRKLQAAAAQTIREKQESTESTEKPFTSVPTLRLPKHLQCNARADGAMSEFSKQQTQSNVLSTDHSDTKPNGEAKPSTADISEIKQSADAVEYEVEETEQDEEDYEDYEGYYYQEEDESAAYYTCEGEAVVRQGAASSTTEHAQIQVMFDQDIYSPKILVSDADTGEILADMLIHTDTEFQMSGDSCTWTGTDYTSNEPADKTVTINFRDGETAMQFYDSCETSKAATYSSTDPES